MTDSESRRIALYENIKREDLTVIGEVVAWVKHIDAEMWQNEEYRKIFGDERPDEFNEEQAQSRGKGLLEKLKSDRRHNTDKVAHKFMRKIESIFSNHPREIDWYSFFNEVRFTCLSTPGRRPGVFS